MEVSFPFFFSSFFFLSLCARAHVHLFFFLFFFFQINVTCDSCIKCTFVLSIPMFLRVYALHSCFIHIHIYICVYQRVCVCVCVCMCVCVCVDPCVRTRLIHLFIAYHLCRVVTNYTYIVQGFFFFFRPAVAPRVCVQRLHTSPKPKVYATRLPWDPAGRSPNSRKYISKILVFLT